MKLSTYKFIRKNFRAQLEGEGELTFIANENSGLKDFSLNIDGNFLIEGNPDNPKDYPDPRQEVFDLYRVFSDYYEEEGYKIAVLTILEILEMIPTCCSHCGSDDD